MPLTWLPGDDPGPHRQKKGYVLMDYENFKERFVEDLKDKLYEKGIEADVTVNTVNKLNDSYEAVTINPVDDQIGVNISINKCFEAYEHGTDYNDRTRLSHGSSRRNVGRNF